MSRLRIAIASLQQESNTLSPILTRREDFDTAFGMDMLSKVHVSDLLEKADAEIVPTLYAHALPGGAVKKEDYLFFADEIVRRLPKKDLDGIWLYLHGAMYVEKIGSGEEYLLKRIREKTGFDIPISVGMDFHANNTDSICELANFICAFRTAPHEDQIETERRAMSGLLYCIEKNLLPRPRIARAYVAAPGDAVQTALPPLCDIMRAAENAEKEPGVLCVQVFGGQSWVDASYMGPSVIAVCEHDALRAQEIADSIAREYYDARYGFKFLIEAVDADEAVKRAMSSKEKVFVTDSGDNTTAGAAGDNAMLLNAFLKAGAKGFLLAGVMDRDAVVKCSEAVCGQTLTLDIGGSLDNKSERASITGRLVRCGKIKSYTGACAGLAATIECDGYTVIVTEKRTAFTTLDIFRSAGVDIDDHAVIIVKLGYLYPELVKTGRRAILALTPGGSAESLEQMGHRHIHRPMYPLDDRFM